MTQVVASRLLIRLTHGQEFGLAIEAGRERARRATLACVAEARTDIARLAARVTALSPQATLERGYAVLQREDGHAVRDPADVEPEDKLTARVAGGRISLRVAS
jgi:exodeoxyribonuclease VII large subunit